MVFPGQQLQVVSGPLSHGKFFLQLHKTDRAEIFVKKLFQLRAFPGQTKDGQHLMTVFFDVAA